jgi:hypothetical protein
MAQKKIHTPSGRYSSNGHHSVTHKKRIPGATVELNTPMIERAKPVATLENGTTSEV